DRLFRFEAKVDDRDLAGTARPRLLLQRLIDGGAEGIRIVNAEYGDGLVMLDELVDQVARSSRGESLRRQGRAIMLLEPTLVLEHFREAFLLDVEQLVEGPRWPLVALDHERAERDRLAPVGMVDRAAGLAVHAVDLAVLPLVIGDDLGEVLSRELLVQLSLNDRAQRVEDLALVEPVPAVVADLGDCVVQVVQHDVLYGFASRAGTMRLPNSVAYRARDGLEKDFKIG